jgi:hypothetical protein
MVPLVEHVPMLLSISHRGPVLVDDPVIRSIDHVNPKSRRQELAPFIGKMPPIQYTSRCIAKIGNVS